jgi:hypothetical protein
LKGRQRNALVACAPHWCARQSLERENKVTHRLTIIPWVIALTASAVCIPQSVQAQQVTQAQLDSLRAQLLTLQSRLDSLSRLAPGAEVQAVQPVQQARTAGAYMNVSFVGLTDFGWSSAEDVEALQQGDHDPHVRGFTIPNAELALDGAVDPYFKAFANIVYKLDTEGETGVELEEMYALSSSLPANLQLKAGQFLTEFGRHNPQHPHSWAFGDQPLVINRLFGPDGLRGQGARLFWLLPTSWYLLGGVTVMNSAGPTTFSFRNPESFEIHDGAVVDRGVHGLGDLLYVPRIETSVDLTSTQTLVVGASAAFGPNNAGIDTRTQIYGYDLYWKWKSERADKGFPFVSFQTEGMTRRYEVGQRLAIDETPIVTLPAETLRDGGFYAQLLWGVKPLIVLGLRGEYVNGNDAVFFSDFREQRTRISPNLTWYPTEFSKFRVQYNYDHRQGIGNDSSLFLQLEFLLGAHAAHKF